MNADGTISTQEVPNLVLGFDIETEPVFCRPCSKGQRCKYNDARFGLGEDIQF